MSYIIITHDGKAHLDELLGSALMALHRGELPSEVIRLDPREAARQVAAGEIPEGAVYIDCGLVLDPPRNLFDHHQDRDLDSSALLLFESYFPEQLGTELHEFIRLVSRVDTRGILSLDDYGKIGETGEYLSFGYEVLLRTYGNNPLLVVELIVSWLEEKIAFQEGLKEAALWLEEPGHTEIRAVAGLKVFRYLVPPPEELAAPLRTLVKRRSDQEELSVMISADPREPEMLTFYRSDYGHRLVDFSRSRPERPVFVHQAGFLMKVIPADTQEWLRLVEESVLREA